MKTLAQIIDNNIAAMGGKEKLLALNSVSMEGTMSINGQEIPVKIIQLNDKGVKVASMSSIIFVYPLPV